MSQALRAAAWERREQQRCEHGLDGVFQMLAGCLGRGEAEDQGAADGRQVQRDLVRFCGFDHPVDRAVHGSFGRGGRRCTPTGPLSVARRSSRGESGIRCRPGHQVVTPGIYRSTQCHHG